MQRARKTRSPQKPPQSRLVSPHPRKPGAIATRRHAAKNETGHPKARRGVSRFEWKTPRRACVGGAAFKDARLDSLGTRPSKSGLCGPICWGLMPCFICPECLKIFPLVVTQAAFAMVLTMASVSMQASRQKSPNRPDLLIDSKDHLSILVS